MLLLGDRSDVPTLKYLVGLTFGFTEWQTRADPSDREEGEIVERLTPDHFGGVHAIRWEEKSINTNLNHDIYDDLFERYSEQNRHHHGLTMNDYDSVIAGTLETKIISVFSDVKGVTGRQDWMQTIINIYVNGHMIGAFRIYHDISKFRLEERQRFILQERVTATALAMEAAKDVTKLMVDMGTPQSRVSREVACPWKIDASIPFEDSRAYSFMSQYDLEDSLYISTEEDFSISLLPLLHIMHGQEWDEKPWELVLVEALQSERIYRLVGSYQNRIA